MADALTDYASLSIANRGVAETATKGYRGTWDASVEWLDSTDIPAPSATDETESGSQGSGSARDVEVKATGKLEWKFQAAQLTYNSKRGDQ